jgi:hypothetical protein
MLVVIKIMGGLGNQLFQYAMGRQLALRRGVPARLDITFFNDKSPATHTLRPYELGIFSNLAIQSLNAAESQQLARTEQLPYRLYNKVRRMLRLSPAFLYLGEGEYFRPNPLVLEGGPPAHLLQVEGYWQNEAYFTDVAVTLRQELAFPIFTDSRNQAVAEQLRTSMQPTVSVHVRRGDYAQYPAFGMCSVDYYERALTYMQQQVAKPAFFVFSDDIAWARENLPLPADTTYIDWNKGTDSYRDMHLMSLCQNHIIANSSFSWWGAWLNPRPTKLVVAPQVWMANPRIMTELVVPAAWICL